MNKKFIESIEIDEWEIETDKGFKPLTHAHKTIPFNIYDITTSKNKKLSCADDHILFNENYNKIFAKDSLNKNVITRDGVEKIVQLTKHEEKENMFDFTVNSTDHRYYTNDILSHNTTTMTIYILHYILFNEYKNVALLANKSSIAREILSRIKLAYENLPNWLQQGVSEWNKGNIVLENGCQVLASASAGDSIRGLSISLLFVDEVAAVDNWDEFYAATFPTISSGKDSKVCLISTAKGLNHYYKLWIDAKEDKNEYVPLEVNWWDIPGRDEEWKRKTIANIGIDRFRQEFGNEFLGSSNTMISSNIIQQLVIKDPIRSENNSKLKYYKESKENHTYVITVDVSRGKGLDNSAFTVIDITESPFDVVCTYYDPDISIMIFPDLLMKIGSEFNDACILIEINDAGISVANDLYYELEYENTVIELDEKNEIGIRTTRSTKSKGCSILTEIIEKRLLLLNDQNLITELSGFVRKGSSFEADKEFHDDLVMCLVIFAYFTTTELFLELKDDAFSIKNEIIKSIDEDDMPFWLIDDGDGEIETVQPISRRIDNSDGFDDGFF